jgi:hypothetical protein
LKRLLDITLALCAGTLLLVPLVLTALAVRCTSTGPALYWSDRVGRNNRIFKMPKFRSMRVDAPVVPQLRQQIRDGHPITPTHLNIARCFMTIPGKLPEYLAAGLANAVVRLSEMNEVERVEMGRKGVALYEQEFERSMLLGRLEAWMLQMAAKPATKAVHIQ